MAKIFALVEICGRLYVLGKYCDVNEDATEQNTFCFAAKKVQPTVKTVAVAQTFVLI